MGYRGKVVEQERARALRAGSDDAFLAAGLALYAGEGSKSEGKVLFANTDPTMVAFFCAWLRHFFDIDEARMRARVYLHAGLDLDATERFWSSPAFHAPSSVSHTGRRQIRPSGGTSTSTAASTCTTAARRRIVGSWAS